MAVNISPLSVVCSLHCTSEGPVSTTKILNLAAMSPFLYPGDSCLAIMGGLKLLNTSQDPSKE